MAPSRTSRPKYNYSEESLKQVVCPHCGGTYKSMGFKKHESRCKRRAEEEQQYIAFNAEFKKSEKKARRAARRIVKHILESASEVPSIGPTVERAHDNLTDFADATLPSMTDNQDRTPSPPLHFDLPGFGSPGPSGQHEARRSPARSDVSMSAASDNPRLSGPQSSQRLPQEFKTEYHPRSGRPPTYQSYEQFRSAHAVVPPEDEMPWRPFCDPGDFEFAEVALDAALNAAQVNKLLDLISRVAAGTVKVTLRNYSELQTACDSAAAELTPFCKHEFTELYKGELRSYEVHARSIWSWALDLLENPLLSPHFVWDADVEVYSL